MVYAMLYAVNIRFAHLRRWRGRRPMRHIYEGDLFKIYFTQIIKTRDLYVGATYNWMRPIYAKIRYLSTRKEWSTY